MKYYCEIVKHYQESFQANRITRNPFRMIGLIEVDMRYKHRMERVILPFYRSSGTNSGKEEGLWYPIVGIKINNGPFTEFSKYANCVLTLTTMDGCAHKGWLVKSLFFASYQELDDIQGYSQGIHKHSLYSIGLILRELYEGNQYQQNDQLDAEYLNETVFSESKLYHNCYSQRMNFVRFIHDIFIGG